jgi:hypothetical protein
LVQLTKGRTIVPRLRHQRRLILNNRRFALIARRDLRVGSLLVP